MANIYVDDLCFRSGSLQWLVVHHTRSKDTTTHVPTWVCTVSTLALKEDDIEFLRKIVTVRSSFSWECSVQCLWPSNLIWLYQVLVPIKVAARQDGPIENKKRLLHGPPNCEQWPSCQSITTLTRWNGKIVDQSINATEKIYLLWQLLKSHPCLDGSRRSTSQATHWGGRPPHRVCANLSNSGPYPCVRLSLCRQQGGRYHRTTGMADPCGKC